MIKFEYGTILLILLDFSDNSVFAYTEYVWCNPYDNDVAYQGRVGSAALMWHAPVLAWLSIFPLESSNQPQIR